MRITEITAEKTKQPTIIRLAAYCRVSSDSDDQLHSFAAQIRYYKDYEKKHPEYTLVDIYADEGITGTCMEKRDELNRLIRDCKKHKVDRIIVKSVSRFARNTEELLVTLRLLKELGVSVYFEEQGIDTDKMNMEMIVTFPGMAAQQESMSISGNMRWSYQKRMQSGEYNCTYPAYGFNLVNNNLEINETEAEIVRLIFDLYLQGIGSTKIAATLNEMDIPRRKDCHKWRGSTILYILDNERYMGDVLLQKKYTTDTLPFRQRRNRGEQAQYYVENSNPAIVSREVFESARRLRTERITHDGYKKADYPLSRILRCPECGRAFRRQIVNDTAYWMCGARAAGESNCHSRRLREDAIYETFTEMTWKLKRHHGELLGTLIRQLEQMQNRNSESQEKIRAIDKSIADLAAQNLVVTRLHTKGILELADYTAQTDDINRKIRDLRINRRQILAEDETDEMIDTLKELESIIEEYHPGTNFDEELFGEIVESIIVDDSTQITFKLIGGVMLTEKIHKKGRCSVA